MSKIWSMVCLCVVITVKAQFSPSTSHYMLSGSIKYPGLWGAQSAINILANTRYQYAGVDGAPLQAEVAVSSPIPFAKGQGIGGYFAYDQLGAYKFIMVNAGYNYAVIKEKFAIGVGASFGIKYSRFDGTKVTTPSGDYTSGYQHNDPYLPQSISTSVVPSMTLGVGFSNSFVSQQLIYSDLFADNISILKDKSSVNYGKTLTSLTKFNIALGSNFYLEPSMQIATNFKQFQHILGATALFKDKVGIGLYTRGYTKNIFESLIPLVRAKAFKNMTFQYSYDALVNGLQVASSGTHELSIIYSMPKTWQKYFGKAINNPRYL